MLPLPKPVPIDNMEPWKEEALRNPDLLAKYPAQAIRTEFLSTQDLDLIKVSDWGDINVADTTPPCAHWPRASAALQCVAPPGKSDAVAIPLGASKVVRHVDTTSEYGSMNDECQG